jgi:hypothetical protein
VKTYKMFTDVDVAILEFERDGQKRCFRVGWDWRSGWVRSLGTLVWSWDIASVEVGPKLVPTDLDAEELSEDELCVRSAVFHELFEMGSVLPPVGAEYYEDFSEAMERSLHIGNVHRHAFFQAVERLQKDPESKIPKSLALIQSSHPASSTKN